MVMSSRLLTSLATGSEKVASPILTSGQIAYFHAIDNAGNIESPDKSVTYANADTTPPTVSLTFPPVGKTNNGQWTNNGCSLSNQPVGLCGTMSDLGSGVVSVAQYELRRTDVATNTCWNGTTFLAAACGTYRTAGGTTSTWSIPLNYASLPNNASFELRIKAGDVAGNSNRPGSIPGGAADRSFSN